MLLLDAKINIGPVQFWKYLVKKGSQVQIVLDRVTNIELVLKELRIQTNAKKTVYSVASSV